MRIFHVVDTVGITESDYDKTFAYKQLKAPERYTFFPNEI